MLTQTIKIEKYDWTIDVFYFITKMDKDIVLSKIKEIGGDEEVIEQATGNIQRNAFNTGFIYSSFNNKHSVIIINHTTCGSEFLNTFVHELTHLASHIGEYYNIDPYDEQAAMLIGNISQCLYPTAKVYLCKEY